MLRKPEFKIFDEKDLHSIHSAIVEVLWKTGARVLSPEARALMDGAGCRVENERVYIPPFVVEDAIRKAPKRFRLFDREGEKNFEVGGPSSHYGTGPTTPGYIDVKTGEKRPTTVEDIAAAARVCDALDNIEWIMPLGSAQDVPAAVSDVYEFEAAVLNTDKPVAFICNDPEGVKDVIEMASAARGDRASLVEKPFILSFPEPICPLVHPAEVIEKILIAAEAGIPQAYFPSPLNGATSPVTLAGTIVLGIADALVGLIIAQLKNPGTPMVLGIATNIMDMSSGGLCHGFPEFGLGVAAQGEVLNYYDLPSWGTAGLTDSKMVDEQAAVESTFSCLLNGLAGINMIHDTGYMEMGMAGSAELVVLTDEILSMVHRVLKGITVNEESLAVWVIDQVGPGGNFLTEEHTAHHFKGESTHIPLMDRQNYEAWKQSGAKSLRERVKQRTLELMETHQTPALPEARRSAVAELRAQSVSKRTKTKQ
jgi:trimethylamine--corrinoid protein Co-methyltransferase